MKSLEFFSRTYTEPGGSEVHPLGEPLRLVAKSRVVYRLYPNDRAVVYSGIDQGVPTKVMPRTIIGLICAAEQLDPVGWSFFDLLTDLQGSNGPAEGDWEFHLISWKMGAEGIEIEGSILLDCPGQVLRDFDRFIACPPDTDPMVLLAAVQADQSNTGLTDPPTTKTNP